MISIVTPFYNEQDILESSIAAFVEALAEIEEEWEIIIVNDGSTDGSLPIAEKVAGDVPEVKLVSYMPNRGRGYAIRRGVQAAEGDLVVVTEVDLSWGRDIVFRIVDELRSDPTLDIVVASPHLPGGGYSGVPWKRVALSKYGNYLIRAGLSAAVTMNTGMTRGYRRDKFLALPLDEDGKELHLEIISKALALHYRIREIPATLTWSEQRLGQRAGKRRPSKRMNEHIKTHLLFSIGTAPFRYMFLVGGVVGLASLVTFGWAVVRLLTGAVSIFLLLTSLLLALLAFLFVSIGLLSHQNRALMSELWRIRGSLSNDGS